MITRSAKSRVCSHFPNNFSSALTGKERGRKIAPTVVQRRAQAIIRPKKAVFIHQCKKCRERQHKREEKIVYQTDAGGIYFLILELCATCMDSNLALAENYATVFSKCNSRSWIYFFQMKLDKMRKLMMVILF